MKKLTSVLIMFNVALIIVTSCNTNTPTNKIVFEKQLSDGWAIISSNAIQADAGSISKPGFDISKWVPAKIPSTVMAALLANGQYPDIFMGDNINKVDTTQFRVPWWYRTEFELPVLSLNTELVFEGINYRANIWLNGKQIAKADSLFGAFRIFKLDISKDVIKGKNVLAVEVFNQKPDEPSIGFVDWAPMAPDRELGLWRPVKIRTSGKTSLDNVFISSKIDKVNYSWADLQVSVKAINHSNTSVQSSIIGTIEDLKFEKTIALGPGEEKEVVFTTAEYPQLHINNPRLWWTYDMGKPELYSCYIQIENNQEISFATTTRFGIREVEDYLTSDGYRGYKLNGKAILIKGGGWVDGMFLNDTEQKVRTQMEYIKHANMNTIRLEGFWGNSDRLYNLADEYGLLIMVGWSCQWEWNIYLARPEDDFMSFRTPEDYRLITNYTNDQVTWLRNHPSIFVWVMGSDKLPQPELEQNYNRLFNQIDTTRPLLMSCKNLNSCISGISGVKMNGPYEYVAPNYWYLDTINGGAFGFNTETGPGPQVPSLDVLKTMIPEKYLWPINEMWDFHCGRFEFQTINRYLNAFENRYGTQSNVTDFTFKNQASNLEAMRAMYEAFAVNRDKTTGIIQWMYNSAWPKLIWQFWDYNLMPNGAFYGARIGARPVNIIYNYGDQSVYVANLTSKNISGLNAEIEIYSIDGKRLLDNKLTTSVNSNKSVKLFEIKEDKTFSPVYFTKLTLTDSVNQVVANNFYWLSTQKDVNDFDNSTWFYTPLKGYANFEALNALPKITIASDATFEQIGDDYKVTVNLKNSTSQVAFLIELNVTGGQSGRSIVPVFWDDNYLSLVPGETRIITATMPVSALSGDKPVCRISGWNLK